MTNLNNDQIVEVILEEGYSMTDDLNEAIYMLTDGRMISGDFDCGMRGTDHRMIECVIDGNRYEGSAFWDRVHEAGLIRMVPETNYALISEGQELTEEQQELINNSDYEIEVY